MTKAKQPFGQSTDPTGLAQDDQREGDPVESMSLDDAMPNLDQDTHIQGGDTRLE